ncbi:MAG TPA: ATP-binding protein [Chloroflexota bacterium]|nr:ATP-binding protein [Chloroflexota bacterium]
MGQSNRMDEPFLAPNAGDLFTVRETATDGAIGGGRLGRWRLAGRWVGGALGRCLGAGPAEPASAAGSSQARDRLELERLVTALRLTFVAVAVLPLLAFGWRAAPYAALIALAALGSAGLTYALMRRWPQALVRHQLALRALDCLLVLLVLEAYHSFLGNAYYDAVYVLVVVAAAATHGRRGALFIALVGAGFVLLGRVLLIDAGALPPDARHFTDAGFYLLFFAMIGIAVAFLMARSQEAVERREQMWRAVLERLPAGVAIAEAGSGQLILGNERHDQLFGHGLLPAGDVQGYAQQMLCRPGGQPYPPDELPLARAMRAGEVVEAEEVEALKPDGSRAILQVSAAPIRDREGRIVAGVVACHDVTWRKRTEETQRFLDDAGERLAGTLEYEATLTSLARLAVPTLADVCIVDALAADGTIRRVAVAHRDARKQALARTLQERFAPDPAAPLGVARTLRTGEPELTPTVTPERLAALARDAEHLEVLRQLGARASMNVPLVARGRILGAITCIATYAGRHYGPEDLALAEELARRAAVAVDNARLYQEANAAIRVRDEFLSSASHDLKNPLVSMKGYAQILEALVADDSASTSRQVAAGLAKIDRAATKMSGLIDELLDVAHLQAGRPLELRRRPTDLVALTQQAVAEQQPTAPRHELRVEPQATSLVGLWDAGRLDRVLGNLLSNAVKYSPAGGTITLRLAREQDAMGAWAVLQVQDQGMGIPAADVPHVFERFHRGGNVTGQIRGAGIGLAGVCQIVEQHGGTVGVESQEGQGATFTVRLPLLAHGWRDDAPSERVPPRADSPAAGSRGQLAD